MHARIRNWLTAPAAGTAGFLAIHGRQIPEAVRSVIGIIFKH